MAMGGISSHTANENYPLSKIKVSDLHLSLPPSLSLLLQYIKMSDLERSKTKLSRHSKRPH